MQGSDNISKMGPTTGIIVFLIGIALLVFTFFMGLSFLMDPRKLAAFAELIPAPEVGSPQGETLQLFAGLSIIVTRVVAYLIPALFIFVLGYVASKIASQGMQMYRAGPPIRPEKRIVEKSDESAVQQIS